MIVHIIMALYCLFHLPHISCMQTFGSKLKATLSGNNNTLDISCINLNKEHNKTDAHLNTPLIYAAQNDLANSVSILLGYATIDINHPNHKGNTALHFAAMQGFSSVLNLLLNDERLDASIQNDEGLKAHQCLNQLTIGYHSIKNKLYKNVLLRIPKYNKNNYCNIAQLIQRDQVNIIDREDTSPLIWAICTNQKPKIIKRILDCPSSFITLNCCDKLFGTALHYAALLYKPKIIKLLLSDYRTNANIKNIFDQFPRDCIITDQCPNYENVHHALFARTWLNMAVCDETFKAYINKKYDDCFVEFRLKNSIIKEIINAIKKRLSEESAHQTEKLPVNAGLPQYADDIFLAEMIQANYVERWIKRK